MRSLAQPWRQAPPQPPPLPHNGSHLVLRQGLPTQSPASSMGQDSVGVGRTLARCLVIVRSGCLMKEKVGSIQLH